MFGLTSKQRNVTKMVCYSKLPFSFMSAEIKPKLILVTKCYSLDRHAFLGLLSYTYVLFVCMYFKYSFQLLNYM